MDPVKTTTELIEPVKVTVIGGTGTGDGNMKALNGQIATTEGHATPNVLVKVVSPLLALAIRFVNVFLPTMITLVSAGMVTDKIHASDFFSLVRTCAELSVAGASLDLLKNIVTIFAGLEKKWPLLTGSV